MAAAYDERYALFARLHAALRSHKKEVDALRSVSGDGGGGSGSGGGGTAEWRARADALLTRKGAKVEAMRRAFDALTQELGGLRAALEAAQEKAVLFE